MDVVTTVRKAGDLLEGDLWLTDQDASRNEINEQLTRVLLGSEEEEVEEGEKRRGMKRRRRRRKKPVELKSDLSPRKGKS